MSPVRSGDGSGCSSYGSAATTTNGSADNRARHSASRNAALSEGVG
jgi:hypothetical protein